MSSLLRSIADIWNGSAPLCALIPFAKVFTGRLPNVEGYPFPYVSIMATLGSQTDRTNKTRYSHGPVSFHIWVDDTQLEFGETVAQAITDVYADRRWDLGNGASVIDMLDEGEAMAHQTTLPTVKAWEVVKLFTACLCRNRVPHVDQ